MKLRVVSCWFDNLWNKHFEPIIIIAYYDLIVVATNVYSSTSLTNMHMQKM